MYRRASLLTVSACAVIALSSVLAGCGGDSNKITLPGTRISVLALERQLRPNLEAADTQIILPSPEDTPAWPSAGGLSHHAMHHLVVPDLPKRAWRREIGEGSSLRNRVFAEPIVSDNRIYTMDADGVIDAFDAKTGKRLWKRKTAPKIDEDNAFLGGAMALEQGRLFATTGAAQVVALDATTGNELWRSPVDTPIRAAPTVNGGRVFVVTVDNQVVAMAANDGRKLWNYAGASASTILLGGTAPAVDGGVVVAALTTGELVALRVDTGTTLWSENIVAVRRTEAAANLPDIVGRPVIDRGRVYAVGQSGIMVAIDLRTGQRVWEVPMAGIYAPWVAGDFLYAISVDSEVICVDTRSGRILWVTQLPQYTDPKKRKGRIVWAGPALASDRLILVNSESEAFSLSPYTGQVMGKIELDASGSQPPVFADATMFLLDDDGQLTAYR